MKKLYGRKYEVVVETTSFSGEKLTITFDVPFDDGPSANIATIQLYNLTEDRINSIKTKQRIYINAGYKESVGVVFTGLIKSIKTEWSGVDKITVIDAIDSGDQWLEKKLKAAYRENTTAQTILSDLLPKTGLKIAPYTLATNTIYRKGKSFDGKLIDAIIEVVQNSGNVMTVNKNTLYVKKRNEGIGTVVYIDSDRGLVGVPTRIEKEVITNYDIEGNEIKSTVYGWKVISLLNYKVTSNTLLEVRSTTANGIFRVESGKHLCNDSQYYTEMEVYPL